MKEYPFIEGRDYVVDQETECWNWTHYKQPAGYGQLTFHRKGYLAHRFSWLCAVGPIPGDLCVLHHCDNPACVSPDHLFLGTRGDNNRDRAAKGRSIVGEDVHNHKLSPADVRAIRQAVSRGDRQYDVADAFGVNQSAISRIWHRKIWQHVDDEASYA